MEGEGTSGSGARGEEGRGGEERRNLKGHEGRVKTAKGLSGGSKTNWKYHSLLSESDRCGLLLPIRPKELGPR